MFNFSTTEINITSQKTSTTEIKIVEDSPSALQLVCLYYKFITGYKRYWKFIISEKKGYLNETKITQYV